MDYKQMCIQQGYVPSTCTMDGQYCWMLVNDQGDPCKGCNANRNICKGRTYIDDVDEEYNRLHHTMSWTNRIEYAKIKENELRREKIIQQRKAGHFNGYTRTILEVKWELLHRDSYIEIIVKDIIDEKAYITKCKNMHEMIHIIKICCDKYNVEQIHVEENGLGQSIYDILIDNIKNVDIAPLRYVKLVL
jgi:hypothetical protein